MELDSPLFIIGSPRSGTSLLRLILTSHDEVVIPPECGFIVWLYEKYKGWSKEEVESEHSINEFINDVLACKKFETWGISGQDIFQIIKDLKPVNYALLCETVYIAFSRKRSKRPSIWGDKNNFHIDYMEIINDIYPKSSFIHIVRDGRDVACSYREVMGNKSTSPYSPKLKTEISAIAREWSDNVEKVERYLEKIEISRKKTIRYEDLVRDTEQAVSEICEWLGLTFDMRMLEFYKVNRSESLEPALTMEWKQRTLEPISSDTVGRYQKTFSMIEQEEFKKNSRMMLKKFGYIK